MKKLFLAISLSLAMSGAAVAAADVNNDVGVYQDAQALAAGLTHHFDNGVSGKIAIAADPSAFSDTIVAGASVGYSW